MAVAEALVEMTFVVGFGAEPIEGAVVGLVVD